MTDPFKEIADRFDIVEAQNRAILSRLPKEDKTEIMTRKMIVSEFPVSLSTIHVAMRNGALPFDKIGRKTIFKREDVERWFKLR